MDITELALDVLFDATKDTLYLIPFLFLTYLVMEWLEHKTGDKAEASIRRAGSLGPLIGSFLGIVPQCGFSAAAATLYAGRVITFGTLFSVFLVTSDEMLPIFIAEQVSPDVIIKILATKVIIGVVMGFIADGVLRVLHKLDLSFHIHVLCEQDHCHCDQEESGIFRSALRHTLQVTLFIFLITLLINGILAAVGEDALASFIGQNPILAIFGSTLVGLVPNCAASVAITQLYLDGILGPAAMMSGLLVSAGVGLLILFRNNRHLKQNLIIVALLYGTGVFWGLIIYALGIVY
ncbi:MAG: putative manganese transporter [Eggerthellaceae bacterium]|jgi:hypothetical protein